MDQSSWSGFNSSGSMFTANRANSSETKLPSGAYELTFDGNAGRLFFNKFNIHSDQLLDLPTMEFKQVVDQLEYFFRPETKQAFKKYGYLYKRSALLWGSWGTGKTCIVSRVAQYALDKQNAIVLFNPHPELIPLAFEQLNNTQPDTPVVVVFEELDKLVQKHEGDLLNILDGEIQKENVVYLATTNYIEEIPARIKRPGRFSSVVEVGFPDANCRMFYLKHKLGENDPIIPDWVEQTDGFSIDELKETVLSVKCLGISLMDVVNRLRTTKKSTNPEELEFESEDKENANDAEPVKNKNSQDFEYLMYGSVPIKVAKRKGT